MLKRTSKSQLAETVERIVLALRRDYLNPLQALELPQIDPANWASWHLRRAAAPIAESKRQAGTTEPPPWLFPTSDELAALDEAVSQLATELGVKRQSDHDRWRMFKRLEHDYSRLKLRAFAQALSKRVENVPGRSADLNLIHRHNDGQGTITYESRQDATPIVENVKAMHNAGLHGSSEMKLAARIPRIMIEKYCNDNGITFQE